MTTTGTAASDGAVRRLWPEPGAPVQPSTLAAASGAGALAALALPDAAPGAALVVVGALMAAAAVLQRRRWSRAELGLAALAGALLVVAAVRDAGWLVGLCLLAATGLGVLTVSTARTWAGAVLTPAAAAVAALRAVPWVVRTASRSSGGAARWVVVARTGAVTAGLLVVFGALLASADAAFAQVLGLLVPDLRLGELPARLVLGAVVAGGALALSFLAAAPPRWELLPLPGARAVRRAEWLVPVVALDVLLLSFLVVQSAVLLAGRDHVLRTAGLTYAEYARSGFGQLLAVTVLVLAVVAAAVRWAPRAHPRPVRAALGVLVLLTLGVAVSALARLHLYEQAYGATRARLFAAAVELWLVVVLLVVARAGARWPATAAGWSVPRAVAASAGAALLALAVLDADAVVADRNVSRHLAGGAVDTAYLGTLSADAVPVLDRLPEPHRSCALAPVARRLDEPAGGWAGANVARSRARAVLVERPVREPDAAACAATADHADRGPRP